MHANFRLVEEHMQARAFMAATTDMALPPTFDAFVKAMCSRNNMTVGELLTIGYVDTTKLGVLQQTTIDKIGHWCQDLVSRNPLGNMANQGEGWGERLTRGIHDVAWQAPVWS